MGTTIADYDGDGRLDIFKTNFSDDTSTLYHNNGDGTFTDATFAAGLGLLGVSAPREMRHAPDEDAEPEVRLGAAV